MPLWHRYIAMESARVRMRAGAARTAGDPAGRTAGAALSSPVLPLRKRFGGFTRARILPCNNSGALPRCAPAAARPPEVADRTGRSCPTSAARTGCTYRGDFACPGLAAHGTGSEPHAGRRNRPIPAHPCGSPGPCAGGRSLKADDAAAGQHAPRRPPPSAGIAAPVYGAHAGLPGRTSRQCGPARPRPLTALPGRARGRRTRT